MSHGGESVDSRLATLEAEYSGIKGQIVDLKDIVLNLRDNHLAHISQEIKDISIMVYARPSWFMSSVMAALCSAVVGLVVVLLKR